MRKLVCDIPIPGINAPKTISVEVVNPTKDSIEVSDASNFNVGDFILIERFGSELSEVKTISSISSDVITFNSNFLYEHPVDIPLTFVDYKNFKVQREDSGSFTDIHTGEINYSNEFNSIIYIDSSSNSSLYKNYKIVGIDSSGSETVIKSFGEDENIAYVLPSEFRNETGFSESEVSESLLVDALNYSMSFIKDRCSFTTVLDGVGRDYSYVLNIDNSYIFNSDGKDGIDDKDFYVYEYDTNRDVAVFINHKINSINEFNNRVSFNSLVPSNSSNMLKFKPVLTYRKYSEIQHFLRRVCILLTANHLLSRVNTKNVRKGIMSWSAGGTNINRDTNSVEGVIKSNLDMANDIINVNIVKARVNSTKLRTQRNYLDRSYPANYSSYNFR